MIEYELGGSAQIEFRPGGLFAFLTGYDRDTIPPGHPAAPILCKPFSSGLLLSTLDAMSGR